MRSSDPLKPRRRLQIGFLGRIIIALTAAGLIPLALVSYRFADLNREAMTSQVLQTHALSANTGADRISSTVSAWETLIDALVAAPEVENDSSSAAAKDTVRSLLQSRGDLVAVVLRDPAGAEIFRGQKKSAASVIQGILANPQRERLEIHSDNGAWLSIVRTLTNGGQAMAIFDARALEDDLHSSELGEQALRVLIDRSRHAVVGNPAAVASIPPALLDIAATGRIRGAGRFPAVGGAVAVGAYAPVDGTPWVVVSTQPATVAEAIAQNLRRRSLFAVIAALLLVAALSVAAWFAVVRPLRDLLNAQSEMGFVPAGDGSDIDRLRSSLDLLQKRVHDREELGNVFLGRYQVLEVVGEGGMGTVFRGWDPKLQRAVALKTIRLGDDVPGPERGNLVESLMREAVTVAQFHHSNVVSIFDVEESGDSAFIAMEFVDGVSLDSQMDGRPLSIEQTLVVGLALGQALEAAHGAHVIHRDIKPANILISWNGTVKVTDFGIAELLSALTDLSRVFGTPGYMAPELIRGRGSLPAGDMFSAGVTLYQCLTGFAPFDRPSMKETLEATLRYEPPLLTVANPQTPLLLEATVMRMLAKDPSERLSRPAELVALTRRMAAEQEFKLNPSTRMGRRSTTKRADPMYVPTISLSKADA
ncbi:MAG: eukaryotic-like serine/threonine-protein kinase [Thermoanaerobaculia bacterium]|jgi:serine/threonine-protein kinase|nr:eukaryotic-like serine/threonine-protein kinase [Thermoanaerobaculia bacterium]